MKSSTIEIDYMSPTRSSNKFIRSIETGLMAMGTCNGTFI